MPKLTLGPNEIMKGWATDFSQSNSAGVEAPAGKYSKSSAASLFRLGKIGQVAPGETFTALTDASTRVNALPLNAAVDSAGEAYVILDNARVVQFGTSDEVIDTTNATAHGAHSSLVGEDILTYKSGSTEYVLYSFNDGTDGDIGRKTVGGAYDDDYMSTVATNQNGSTLTLGVPHQMKIGPDKNVFITNGQYIAKFTISNSTIDYQALNLGSGFVATGLEVHNNYLVIVGYKAYTTSFVGLSRSEATCWFWDTTSPFYNNIYDLKDNYASAVFESDNLYAFTSGRNSTTKIKIFTGSGFKTLFEAHTSAIGNAPRQGSVGDFQNMLHFAPKESANIHCLNGDAFHHRMAAVTSDLSTPSDVGMVKNIYQNALCVGRKVGSSYSIVKTNYDGYYPNASFRYPIVSLPYHSTVYKIVVYFSQFGSGASLTLSLFGNYDAVSVGGADDLANQVMTYATLGARSSYAFNVNNAFDLDTFLIHLTFGHSAVTDTAAIVRKIEVYYNTPEKF